MCCALLAPALVARPIRGAAPAARCDRQGPRARPAVWGARRTVDVVLVGLHPPSPLRASRPSPVGARHIGCTGDTPPVAVTCPTCAVFLPADPERASDLGSAGAEAAARSGTQPERRHWGPLVLWRRGSVRRARLAAFDAPPVVTWQRGAQRRALGGGGKGEGKR
ncbi:MAG: hypothetical protein J3K34DRAFT_49074 [Monoraphidium minutum]|nr:MAG: hypothetical protein J3K34DRAFT_49074 [Monoraphidium minutum]